MNYRTTITVVIGHKSTVVHNACAYPDSGSITLCGIRLREGDFVVVTENLPNTWMRYANCKRCSNYKISYHDGWLFSLTKKFKQIMKGNHTLQPTSSSIQTFSIRFASWIIFPLSIL